VDYVTRVEDALLVQVSNLARIREITQHAALEDFRASAVLNRELSRGTDDEAIWRLRVERCDMLLANPKDDDLRRRIREAVERDR
jgi:hypothetical protein